MTSIKALVAALSPRDEELRLLGSDPVAIAGRVGGIFSDLEMRLAISRLSPLAKSAAVELVDAGAVSIDDAGRLWVVRTPIDGERKLFREALGLAPRRDQ